ncbi:MAG: translation initiation factor IF-2 [Candidatus Lloydbacteria bacterium CG22_combo_CG10-13_8_21_14_all_47_15]|uniref:Translation initiation factor IF-2 n=1 Tax=Candidatus Lloydbacteria bacterium CG22_combo_CG10-13_8_21_14_all_47_15 TaxID=1974635 RepID=A0A2H0CU92_9BACT|nr:MAG: translation initiation factor IF-2 [Candidatus Lloydbacteria bacterium CG22_combo_CG10-13_8_21_14_all_47_15]
MEKPTEQGNTGNTVLRPPVVVVMGHIDHGKSTLLDYIRKTNVVEKEAGGITQRISAYEAEHAGRAITFLDTPGHEAFSSMRECGVCCADIAILVVSAEDGVKAQTLEALTAIRTVKVPFVVAINKIDKAGANVEHTKQSLAENDVFVEGYGGDIPFAAISAKTGEGVDNLLDTILLVADLEELTGNKALPASGIILESNVDAKRGVAATLIIKNGTLKKGQFVAANGAFSPVRIMENFLGKPIDTATVSSPVQIIGWNSLPPTGSTFTTFNSKKDAEKKATESELDNTNKQIFGDAHAATSIPLVIKTDAAGGIAAIKKEIAKISVPDVSWNIIKEGVGDISENDIKTAHGTTKDGKLNNALVVGFNVGIDRRATQIADRAEVPVKTFSVIYDIGIWLIETAERLKPKVEIEETTGTAKIIRVFSQTKNKQVLGGRVKEGVIHDGDNVQIIRREYEIGRGKIRELQQQKAHADDVSKDMEFGVMVESKTEIAEGDTIAAFTLTVR